MITILADVTEAASTTATISTVLLQFVIILPATIAACAAFFQSKNNAAKQDVIALKQEGKTEEVHKNTNGTLGRVSDQLEAALREVKESREEITKLAKLLAEKDKLAPVPAPVLPVTPGVVEVKVVNTPDDPAMTEVVPKAVK